MARVYRVPTLTIMWKVRTMVWGEDTATGNPAVINSWSTEHYIIHIKRGLLPFRLHLARWSQCLNHTHVKWIARIYPSRKCATRPINHDICVAHPCLSYVDEYKKHRPSPPVFEARSILKTGKMRSNLRDQSRGQWPLPNVSQQRQL